MIKTGWEKLDEDLERLADKNESYQKEQEMLRERGGDYEGKEHWTALMQKLKRL